MQFMKSLPAQMQASMLEDCLPTDGWNSHGCPGESGRQRKEKGIPMPANSTVQLRLKLHVCGGSNSA